MAGPVDALGREMKVNFIIVENQKDWLFFYLRFYDGECSR